MDGLYAQFRLQERRLLRFLVSFDEFGPQPAYCLLTVLCRQRQQLLLGLLQSEPDKIALRLVGVEDSGCRLTNIGACLSGREMA